MMAINKKNKKKKIVNIRDENGFQNCVPDRIQTESRQVLQKHNQIGISKRKEAKGKIATASAACRSHTELMYHAFCTAEKSSHAANVELVALAFNRLEETVYHGIDITFLHARAQGDDAAVLDLDFATPTL